MPQLIKRMIIPNPKFRIISRGKKFVPQEFFGIWKVGIYADIAKNFNLSAYIPFQFEHENLTEAESVIAHRQKQLGQKGYIVKDYYKA